MVEDKSTDFWVEGDEGAVNNGAGFPGDTGKAIVQYLSIPSIPARPHFGHLGTGAKQMSITGGWTTYSRE